MGSAEPALMNERFRFTFGLSLGLAGLADVVLIAGATPILEIFGPGYAGVAATPMRILALGVFPLIVKTHYVAVHRVQKTLRRAVPIAWAGTVLELGGGALGAAVGGLSGVAIGWLGGLLIEAIVMGGDVRRALSRRSSAAVEIGAGGSPAPR
jgi:O-antigen/teichoic acid export membrane protein